jgi:hypothetical protein
LRLLQNKYEELIDLRTVREDWESAGKLRTPDEEMEVRQERGKSLATEFPGALRQLECLDVKNLLTRRDIVRRYAEQDKVQSAELPLWICVEWDYHLLHKEALAFKAWKNVRRKENFQVEVFADFYAWWQTEEHRATPIASMSEGLFLEWCAPPGGQFSKLIWRCLEEYYRIPEASLKQMLFVDVLNESRIGQ